jgi:hypothetical protein
MTLCEGMNAYLQQFAVKLNHTTESTLVGRAQEVFSGEKHALMWGWLDNNANRYRRPRRNMVDTVERGGPKREAAWANSIANRCRCFHYAFMYLLSRYTV